MPSARTALPLRPAFAGKTVLVTGNTGFKGSWLSAWLLKLGARVVGLSKDVPTQPAMFDVIDLGSRMRHHVADIRDLSRVRAIVATERPDFVMHLAAQSIVSLSYADPVETVTTNAVGTMNVLEALRTVDWPCIAVMITSDKSYANVEWVWGYRETDALGGKDPYSGSKAAAEMILRAYVASFFQPDRHSVRIGVARAGNVIGGGDWARDRVVGDCVRAWTARLPVDIRNPDATRPWQHVLEPLSGYLTLGAALATAPDLCGEPFNFGPRAEQNHTVLDLVRKLAASWSAYDAAPEIRVAERGDFHEATLLKLNCDKALLSLAWEPTLSYDETVRLVGAWYVRHAARQTDMYAFTCGQIEDYETLGRQRGRVWAEA